MLTADFDVEPRASVEQQSFEPPFARWSDPSAYGRGASWGPRARTWPAPSVPPGVDPLTWRRERLLAVARRYLGYDYQHHHIPDWLPPPDWPSRTERRSRGLDCSNFTSWVYNFGLGVRITSNVRKQAEIEGLRLEGDYATLRRTLETGDLLFMRGQDGISHVVMWVGAAGQPADEPLVVDSTSNVRTDSRGTRIPAGIHLRPFREGSWYHRSFSHALRLVHGPAAGAGRPWRGPTRRASSPAAGAASAASAGAG